MKAGSAEEGLQVGDVIGRAHREGDMCINDRPITVAGRVIDDGRESEEVDVNATITWGYDESCTARITGIEASRGPASQGASDPPKDGVSVSPRPDDRKGGN